MNKDKISSEITRYTTKKIIIVGMMLISITTMIVCVILYQFWQKDILSNISILSYFCVIIMMFIACRFDMSKVLMKVISIDDYKEILKYLSDIPDEIMEEKYYDGLLMIRRTLNGMVYYHMNGIDGTYRQHLCYLQSLFIDKSNKNLFSPELLNKTYLRKISEILLKQINDDKFDVTELDNVNIIDENIRKKLHVTSKMIVGLCNGVLICFVLVKMLITINDTWYSCVNDSLFLRIMYNTSIDIIAAVLAIISLREK